MTVEARGGANKNKNEESWAEFRDGLGTVSTQFRSCPYIYDLMYTEVYSN